MLHLGIVFLGKESKLSESKEIESPTNMVCVSVT